MKEATVFDDIEIAPGTRIADWKALQLDMDASQDWKAAVAILDARISQRFLEPVDALITLNKANSEKTFGFAILAIQCLIIETIQAFREGITNHRRKSRGLFTRFLVGWPEFTCAVPANLQADKVAGLIYEGFRCALHHSGSTKDDFRVLAVGPTFRVTDGIAINRTKLQAALKGQFQMYLSELSLAENVLLRQNYVKKMNGICGIT